MELQILLREAHTSATIGFLLMWRAVVSGESSATANKLARVAEEALCAREFDRFLSFADCIQPLL